MATNWDAGKGLIVDVAQRFEDGGETLMKREATARDELQTKSSDPTVLAKYQAIISEISIWRNAQSSTVKVFKDIDATIVANFR